MLQQHPQAHFLRIRARIFSASRLRIAPAYVADANRVGIVPRRMRANKRNVPTEFDCAVQINNVVVTNIRPAVAVDMPAPDVLSLIVTSLWRIAAVHNYFVNCSHRPVSVFRPLS